jgi:hypothetical protein
MSCNATNQELPPFQSASGRFARIFGMTFRATLGVVALVASTFVALNVTSAKSKSLPPEFSQHSPRMRRTTVPSSWALLRRIAIKLFEPIYRGLNWR